ncbi:MAG: TonB-dependent receptor plug domain-containing protein [Chitinivibrionales bacterium]|nr:TonB-dependent receptor plug domain-containing protein [Chitinivibrionales bacterium]
MEYNRLPLVRYFLQSYVVIVMFAFGTLESVYSDDIPSQNIVQRPEDGVADSAEIIVEGLLIDGNTGAVPDDDSIVVMIDSFRTPVDTLGNFILRLRPMEYHTISVISRKYEKNHKIITISPDRRNYFATFTLIPATTSQSVVSTSTKSDTINEIPWTIRGYVVDEKGDIFDGEDTLIVMLDNDTIPVTTKGSFQCTTLIGGIHALGVFTPEGAGGYITIECNEDRKNMYTTLEAPVVEGKPVRRQLTVRGTRQPIHTTAQPSRTDLPNKEIRHVSGTISDPLRVLHTLPGVSSENDVSSRCIIRGGDEFEARIFLDGVPLLQPYHFGGVRSTFNQMAVDELVLYKSAYPAEYFNAQSGIIAVESRGAVADSFSLTFDANMLQYSGYVNVPLINHRFGISASTQGSYTDFLVKTAIKNAGENFDAELKKHIDEFKDLINMPDYRDYSTGLHFKPSDIVECKVNYLYNTDRFRYVVADSITPIMYYYRKYYMDYDDNNARFYDDFTGDSLIDIHLRDTIVDMLRWVSGYSENKNYEGEGPLGDELRYVAMPSQAVRAIDTLVDYGSKCNSVIGNIRFTPGKNHVFELIGGRQQRKWDLMFPPDSFSYTADTSLYNVKIERVNGSLSWLYSGWENHLFDCGIQLEYCTNKYDVSTGWVLHNIVTKGSVNFGDHWGMLTGDSGMIALVDSIDTVGIYDVSGVRNRLFIRYSGGDYYYSGSFFLQDEWNAASRLKITTGLRLDYSQADSSISLSPRIGSKYSLNNRNELIASAGHYIQNDYTPALLALSNNLVPEKVWHLSIGIESKFVSWLTQKIDVYGKYYYDLSVENAQTVYDHMRYSPEDLRYLLNEDDRLADSLIDSLYRRVPEKYNALLMSYLMEHEDYYITYSNTGAGYGYGIEYLLRFDPGERWFGWISLGLGRAFRRRNKNSPWRPFMFDRPFSASLVNYYRLPRRYELGIKYRFITGYPYTETDFSRGIYIGSTNGKRYSPYQRLDLRILKEVALKRGRFHIYIELWNMLNSPNVFLADSKSQKVERLGINIPFTTLFMGCEYTF